MMATRSSLTATTSSDEDFFDVHLDPHSTTGSSYVAVQEAGVQFISGADVYLHPKRVKRWEISCQTDGSCVPYTEYFPEEKRKAMIGTESSSTFKRLCMPSSDTVAPKRYCSDQHVEPLTFAGRRESADLRLQREPSCVPNLLLCYWPGQQRDGIASFLNRTCLGFTKSVSMIKAQKSTSTNDFKERAKKQDDLNEMRALLDTGKSNRKVLQTKHRSSPQKKQSKHAPVYFTT